MEIFDDNTKRPISVGDWFVTILIMAIPLVNLVMLLIWSFGADTNPNKANWAKATLIWMVVGIVLWILLASTIIGMIGAVSLMNKGIVV